MQIEEYLWDKIQIVSSRKGSVCLFDWIILEHYTSSTGKLKEQNLEVKKSL